MKIIAQFFMKTRFLLFTLSVTLFGLSGSNGADFQPDLSIGDSPTALKGDNKYKNSGQKNTLRLSDRQSQNDFFVGVENDGDNPDQVKLRGRKGNKHFRIDYFDQSNGGANVTAAIVKGRYVTAELAPAERIIIRGEIEPKRHGKGKGGKRSGIRIKGTSLNKASAKDQVRLTVITPKESNS